MRGKLVFFLPKNYIFWRSRCSRKLQSAVVCPVIKYVPVYTNIYIQISNSILAMQYSVVVNIDLQPYRQPLSHQKSLYGHII